MFQSNKKRGLGRTAATGLLFDPEVRRAVAQAIPPVTRLGYVLGRRHLTHRLGLAESEASPRRQLLPLVGGAAAVAITIVVATDPARRHRLQRLFVH